MRRFELVDESSNKFWEIHLDGSSVTTRWGRIGTAGQSKTLELASPEKARAKHDALVAEKTGKGYREITSERLVTATSAAIENPAPWKNQSEMVAEFLKFSPVPAELISSDFSVLELEAGLANPLLDAPARARVEALLKSAGWKAPKPEEPYVPHPRTPPKPLELPDLAPRRSAPKPVAPPQAPSASELHALPLAEFWEKRVRALMQVQVGRPQAGEIAAFEALELASQRDPLALSELFTLFRERVGGAAWRALFARPLLPLATAEQLFDEFEKNIKYQGQRDSFSQACLGLLENRAMPIDLRRRAARSFPPPSRYETARIEPVLVDRVLTIPTPAPDSVLDDLILEVDTVECLEILARDPAISDGALRRLLQKTEPKHVSRFALLNPASTSARLERIALSFECKIVFPAELAQRTDLSEVFLEYLARHSPRSRPTIAQRPDQTGRTFEVLLNDWANDPAIGATWTTLARNQTTTRQMLQQLWLLAGTPTRSTWNHYPEEHNSKNVRQVIAQRAECAPWLDGPTAREAILLDERVGATLLQNRSLGEATRLAILEQLSRGTPSARSTAARHGELTARLAQELVNDTEEGVRFALALNTSPSIPDQVSRQLAADPVAAVRVALVRHPSGLRAFLAVMSAAAHPMIRYLASLHPMSPTPPSPSMPVVAVSRDGGRPTLAEYKAKLERYAHGLLRHHEGDTPFSIVAIESTPDQTRAISVLRALGHVRSATPGALERSLAHRLSMAVDRYGSKLKADVAEQERIREANARFLTILATMKNAHEVEISNPEQSAGETGLVAAVAEVDLETSEPWVAFVPPYNTDRANGGRGEPLARPEPWAGDQKVEAFLKGVEPRLSLFGVERAERMENEKYSTPVWWWGLASGASADEALERALLRACVLRRRVEPWEGYKGFEDEENPTARYEKLNAELRGLRDLSCSVYGLSSPYDEMLIGTSAEGHWLACVATCSWT